MATVIEELADALQEWLGERTGTGRVLHVRLTDPGSPSEEHPFFDCCLSTTQARELAHRILELTGGESLAPGGP